MISIKCRPNIAQVPIIAELKISAQLCPKHRKLIDCNLPGSDGIWLKAFSPQAERFITAKQPIDLHIKIDDQNWHTSVHKATLIDDGSDSNLILECRWEGEQHWRHARNGIFYACYVDHVVQYHLKKHYRYSALQIDYKNENESRFPWHPSLMQWQESDGAFCDRQLMRHGVWHFFEHDEQGVKLCLGDENSQFAPIQTIMQIKPELSQSESCGLKITQAVQRSRQNLANIIFWQLNEADPENHFSHSEDIQSFYPNQRCERPSPFSDVNPSQLKCLTQNAANAIRVQQSFICGEIQAVNLQVGQRFKMDEKTYLTQEVLYHFKQINPGDYETEHQFLAYELNHPYRPDFDPAEDYQAQPRIHGHLSNVKAWIDPIADNNCAIPDDWGRVPLQLPLAFSVKGTKPYRYIQRCDVLNHQTANSSFPLYGDSNGILMFIDDDPDRPVLIGCIADSKTGHLFEGRLDERSELKMPQGQYWQNSNHDSFNQLSFGTPHSHITLQNDPKKTDNLWQSAGDFECRVSDSYQEKHGLYNGLYLWEKTIRKT